MNKHKRMNGEGSLRQRPDGRWECRITDGYRDDGKLRAVSFYAKTQKEVKAKLEEYRKKKSAGIDLSKKYTFAQWADIWFDQHTDISATTKEGYKYTLRHLKNEFGKMPLEEIKAMHIEQFLKRLRAEGKADSSVAQCRGMLFQIFNKAEANDLVRKNPVRYADKMRSSNPPKEKEAFTAEEVKLLMAKLPTDRIGLSIRLMLGTGMRTQEIMALEPRHIAEDGSVIEIQQAVVRIKGGVAIGPPKSRDSYRRIPVPPKLQYCAIRLRDTNRKFIWEVGVKDQPCNPTHFAKLFREAVGQVEGVRVLTPHSCRHTYVSQLQGLGVDIETIKSIVGHADINMTEHYLHVQEPIRKDAVTRFSDTFIDFENVDEVNELVPL